MSKEKLTAEQIAEVKKHMLKLTAMDAGSREQYIAATIGDVYDVELPIPEVIDAISNVQRADVGEHVYYLSPDDITKTLFTLTSDCVVTQTRVTPNTRQELSFTDLISPEYYVCIQDWLKGDHNVLTFYGDSINESMNRQEIYAVLQLIDAGAVAESNTFGLMTGADTFDYPTLVAMARSLARYGSKLVLITGANVTTDIMLMTYDANRFQQYKIEDLVSKWLPVEDLTVAVNGSTVHVIDPNTAYLVATSDAKANRPIVFSRRKLEAIATADTAIDSAKERAVIDTGNMINVGTNRKFSKGKAGYEEYGAVLLNSKVVAKFVRA